VSHAEIDFLLCESIVDVHECGVGVEVAHAVVGVLGVELEVVAAEEGFSEVALDKGVPVPLALRVFPDIVHDGARDALVAVVEIAFDVPFALRQVAEEAGFGAPGTDISVLPDRGSVPRDSPVRQHLAIAEVVTPVRVGVLGIGGEVYVVGDFLLVEERGVGKAESARLHCEVDVEAFAVSELRAACFDIERAGTAVVFGGLEDFGFLSVVERELLDVVHGELAEVHGAVLGVADFDAVVEDSEVVGAHGAHIDRFESADTSVVLNLHTGEVTHRVSDALRGEGFETRAFQLLDGDDRLLAATCADCDLVKVEPAGDAVGAGKEEAVRRRGLRGRMCTHSGKHSEKQYVFQALHYSNPREIAIHQRQVF